jgi:hypothetical protein
MGRRLEVLGLVEEHSQAFRVIQRLCSLVLIPGLFIREYF